MPRVPMWRRYLHFWRPNVEDDVDEEIGFHLQSRVEDLKAEGWSPKAAPGGAASLRQRRECA